MSKGVHLVMPRSALDASTGMIIRTEKSVLFFIPWGSDRWIVGTTDTDWSGDRDEPAATAEDVDYLLAQANRVLEKPLTRADVIGIYAGLRPLVAAAQDTPTTKLSREHVVDAPVPGLVSIAGGKFTTYRLMARDVIDAAVADFDGVPESVTDQLPLLGADGLPAVRAAARRISEDYGVPLEAVEHLVTRYGSLATEVLDPVLRDRSLAGRLADGYPYLRAEVAYAVTHEGALHIEDVLARRVRLLIESPDAGVPAAAEVSAIMGGILGWGRRRRAAEVRRYAEFAETSTEALRSPSDLPSPGTPEQVAVSA
jgi:glycerol-3-phosphate dehydrogenase